MKTLKKFNSLSPDKQCDFVIDLLENESEDVLGNFIEQGIEQGESKDNFVKIIMLFKKFNLLYPYDNTSLNDFKLSWIKTMREDKLSQILRG